MGSVKCKNCGKEIRVDNNRYESVKNICCSNECRYEFARKNNKNEYILKDDICLIKIKDKIVKIDIDDVERVKKYTWFINNSGYVMTTVHTGRKDKKGIYHNILLHRFIMNCPKNKIIDHINHNGLDNRKCNLRICTYEINKELYVYCKDCTDCLLKQIVEKCKRTLSINKGSENEFTLGKMTFAEFILKDIDIQEVE